MEPSVPTNRMHTSHLGMYHADYISCCIFCNELLIEGRWISNFSERFVVWNLCVTIHVMAKQRTEKLLKTLKDNVWGLRAFAASGYAMKQPQHFSVWKSAAQF